MPTKQQTEMDFRDSPTYWFACFRMAVSEGDYESQRKSQQELERLGYEVEFINGVHSKKRSTP
jgi:hypothetical protein